jgi:DNA-binding GntR family transcriptional regulator
VGDRSQAFELLARKQAIGRSFEAPAEEGAEPGVHPSGSGRHEPRRTRPPPSVGAFIGYYLYSTSIEEGDVVNADFGPLSASVAAGGNRQQLSEYVATVIREAIMAGELRGGGFVRTEQLATRLRISATPVREALMLLHSEGVVRWERRRGFRIVPVTRRDITDLFEVAAFISGELAARAAPLISDADKVRLNQLQAELEDAARHGQPDETFQINHQIHRIIHLPGLSNRLAWQLQTALQYVPRNYYAKVPGWVDASVHDHAAIFVALDAADPDGARAAMTEHMRHIGELLAKHLEAGGVFDDQPNGTVVDARS